MSKDSKALTVQASALSDRGLNERRPLNEDSYLADAERSIFAVADGVGGADDAGGSGLRGLADRVEALGGQLRISSPLGTGTTISAVIPCAS